jgi:hypothetical protein
LRFVFNCWKRAHGTCFSPTLASLGCLSRPCGRLSEKAALRTALSPNRREADLRDLDLHLAVEGRVSIRTTVAPVVHRAAVEEVPTLRSEETVVVAATPESVIASPGANDVRVAVAEEAVATGTSTNGVCSLSTKDVVCAVPSDNGVGVWASFESVASIATFEEVGPMSPVYLVRTFGSEQLIRAVAARQDVVAVPSDEAIDPESAGESVAAWAAYDDVIALITTDEVVAEATPDCVVSFESDDYIVSRRSNQNVVTRRPRHCRNLTHATRKLTMNRSCEEEDKRYPCESCGDAELHSSLRWHAAYLQTEGLFARKPPLAVPKANDNRDGVESIPTGLQLIGRSHTPMARKVAR